MSADTYTVLEVADKMGLNRSATYEALKRGEIPHLRIGRLRIIPRQAFDSWWNSAGEANDG